MSDTLFPARPGVVGVHQGLEALPVTVSLYRSDSQAGLELPTIMKAILTGFDLVGEGAVSTNLTLRQKIFVTVVGGEKPGRMTLSGLWFPGVCPGTAGLTGIDKMVSLYEALRVATTGQTVNVVIARATALLGVVTRFQARLVDPATGVGEWSMLLDYMPRGVLGVLPGTNDLVGTVGLSAIAGATRG